MNSTSNFTDLASTLQNAMSQANTLATKDQQIKAFMNSKAITDKIAFGIQAAGSPTAILIDVSPGHVSLRSGDAEEGTFVLSAKPKQWAAFFKQTPAVPYQSFWGLVGMNNPQEGVEIKGDRLAFVHWAPIWRRMLELLHDVYAGPYLEEAQEELDEDVIVGRYVVLKDMPIWGRSKVYYEKAGSGDVQIVFCHTAGSDCRQYNRVMNDPRMLDKCTMYSFDLPAHGKSFPYENYSPGSHTNTEESYVGCIAAFIKALALHKPIVCGASMAGQVSLACAIHAEKVGCGGTIPIEGCDYLNMDRVWEDQSPFANQALLNPEWVYGMMSPTAPFANKQLIWHLYSGQAYGIFHGDLDFYFGGWDGRSRMKDIDTKECPVYMLTGEYDWSTTPEMSQATCDKILGGKYRTMNGLGHFPATEKPRVFVEYLLEAIDHIVKTRS